MLFVVDWVGEEGGVHVPADQPLKALQEVVGQGDRAEGFSFVVAVFAGLGYEYALRALPGLGCVSEVDARLVCNEQGS